MPCGVTNKASQVDSTEIGLILSEVINNLEPIFRPTIKDVITNPKPINHFNLCNCLDGRNWSAFIVDASKFLGTAIDTVAYLDDELEDSTIKTILFHTNRNFDFFDVANIDETKDVIIFSKPVIHLNRAVVEVRLIYNQRSNLSFLIYLIKENGNWKMIQKKLVSLG